MGMTPPSRILLCAHSPLDVEDVRRLLEQAGHTTNWHDADAVGPREFAACDLIVLDLSHGERETLELCQRLRARLADRLLPIVVLVGGRNPDMKITGLDDGADGCFVRPFLANEFLAQVNAFPKGTSEFTLKLEPRNLGVLLRRKLDYAFPNQRALVFVADATQSNEGEPRWQRAGVWYLAGSNTCMYSNPREELGATQHQVQTSNRRFRDDEFLVPRELTEGRSAIRVRIQFTPVKRPLFPGHPLPELAWSEIRYSAYCFVIPQFSP